MSVFILSLVLCPRMDFLRSGLFVEEGVRGENIY